ncbi:hypothetical protein N7457_005172, partial [Penicillium paradoxum]|uniref:uncharacterized protein n=1 Tax=Penicillium paradoxum TaxID=176176 RepID=UPI002548DBBD
LEAVEMEGNIHLCTDDSHSSLSLSRPGGSQVTEKRRLLLVYIHGFMGSEASFHDLPLHVHDLLTGSLSESHVVYTRMYPRYKSQGEIQTAVDQFSAWISPHEAHDLDVILLGHSLGGILAADVARLQQSGRPKHRILGIVGFDVPFLGIHPRVIPTGTMGSMPKRNPAAEEKLAGEQESLGLQPAFKPPPPNPNFDPPFMNDVRLVERGFLKGIMHFVNKNTDNLSRSIFDRLMSPLKFAGCVNNYSELRQRYRHLMEMENAESSPERVRFINYYTASTGRKPKPRKSKEKSEKKSKKSQKDEEHIKEAEDIDQTNDTMRTDLQEYSKTLDPCEETETTSSMSKLSMEEQTLKSVTSHSSLTTAKVNDENEPLSTEEKGIATSTAASVDHIESPSLPGSVSLSEESGSISISESTDLSKQQLRKFILLPSHHWKYNDNSHWQPILMEDMDEVMAHQSMFIPQGENYDHLVGDSVGLIEQWIENDLSRRFLQENLD